MANVKRSELQHFVNRREKAPPPVFAGRKSILADILTIAAETRPERGGIPGNTTLITGAPGAGKSSVLSELTRFNTDPSEEGPKAMHISSVELEENLSDVLLAIGALGQAPKTRLKSIALKGVQGLGGLALLDVADLINVNIHTIKDLFREQKIHNIGSLHKVFPASKWDTPVIVAVDEAQNLPSGRGTPQSNFLRALHEAVTKLPLTLVLAGLGDTHSVSRSMGLTHGISPYSLGCFSPGELHELTEKWCDHFRIKIGSCRSQIDDLMDKTDGWPRHVHWAQQALAEALLIKGVDGHADQIKDWTAVHRRSDTLRHGYYGSQYSDVMIASRKLVGRVMLDVTRTERAGNGLTFGQVVDVADRFNGQEPGSEWTLPEDMNARSYVTHLIHCGALEENLETGSLSCPIPSFQNYILRRGGIDPAALEQTLNEEEPSFKTKGDTSYSPFEPKPLGDEDDDP